MNQNTKAKYLLESFLSEAKKVAGDVEPIRVLRCNAFRINNTHVLVRVAADIGQYFFGLNYINAEEVANLDNSFIAFVCGSVEHTLIIPMQLIVKQLPEISHDRNGEFKILINKDYELYLKGRGKRFPLRDFLNRWDMLLTISKKPSSEQSSAEQSFHSVIQGRLLEIGNIRGLYTYCPNKMKIFNNRELGKIAKLEKCPELQYTNYDSLRNIDIIWFRQTGKEFYPERAFEVELSTGIWSGVGRLTTLREYNTPLIIISSELKRYSQVIDTQPSIKDRFRNVLPENVGALYMAEKRLCDLRMQIGI
jgi:hypothetical protein